MTKLNDIIVTGKVNRPLKFFLFGTQGIGKTWLAANAFPNPVIVDLERGADNYDCAKIFVANDEQLHTALELLLHEKHDYETVVFDTVGWCEHYLTLRVCRELKVESVDSLPYGRVYIRLREEFLRFLLQLNHFIYAGKHVLLIAHSETKQIQPPGLTEPYDRYQPELDRCNSQAVMEWSDVTAFADYDLRIARSKDGYTRAIGGREKFLYVNHSVSFDAKNRFGIEAALKFEPASIAQFFTTAAPTTPAVAPPSSRSDREAAPAAERAMSEMKTVADPDQEPVDPFLSPRERRDVNKILDDLPQDKLLKFLRDRAVIAETQDRQMLGPTYLRRILANPQNFKDAVLSNANS